MEGIEHVNGSIDNDKPDCVANTDSIGDGWAPVTMSTQQEPVSLDLDRRSFMKASALAGGVALGVSGAGRALQEDSEESDGTDTDTELTKTICNYCSVGCGFRGEREGNSFVGMEPWHEHPIKPGRSARKGPAYTRPNTPRSVSNTR